MNVNQYSITLLLSPPSVDGAMRWYGNVFHSRIADSLGQNHTVVADLIVSIVDNGTCIADNDAVEAKTNSTDFETSTQTSASIINGSDN